MSGHTSHAKSHALHERNAAMRQLRAAGWTLRAIGARYDLSEGRVRELVTPHAAPRHVVTPRTLGAFAPKRAWRRGAAGAGGAGDAA
jgi:hypothetical protein